MADPRHLSAGSSRELAARDAERVHRALASSLAENTRRAYLGHWAAFSEWCEDHDYFPAPADPETIAAHLAVLVETASASTLKVRRAELGTAHRAAAEQAASGQPRLARARGGRPGAASSQQVPAPAGGPTSRSAWRSSTRARGTRRPSGRSARKARARDRVFGLSGRQIGRRVEAAACAAGLGSGFSGHSGRVGLAAELSRLAATHDIAEAPAADGIWPASARPPDG